MLGWSKQEIDWYRAAEAESDYFDRLAQLIARELPLGAALHDLGCGIGSLAVRLARRGFAVTAVDTNPQAVAQAGERARQEKLWVETLVADYTTLSPPVQYPVLCLCGDIAADLGLFERWGSKRAVVVTLDADTLPFKLHPSRRGARSSRETEDLLRQAGVGYRTQKLSAMFGQPLDSYQQVVLFARHHNPEGSQAEIARWLEDSLTNVQGRYYLPNVKAVTLFYIDCEDAR